MIIWSVVAIIVAYLCGSIPFGVIVARLYGVNVLASGSGRTGGTNVLRSAGPLAAGLTVLGDVMKGLLPIFFIHIAFPPLVVALAMTAAVLGHNYSIFLGFRGGVGAGTAVGTVGGINFWAGLTVAICGLIGLAVTRYASILSTAVAVSSVVVLTIGALLGWTPYLYILGSILTMLVMFYALRENFARIRAGTERKVGQKTENIAKI
ncbi:MAG: glycerol-3-phosphate acyltransferase [Anaerolineaceae bacterium]|nr:glycerol-3-phosphate acyltransferase [Anaerolineaceae bacterium]MCB9101797.1 glycerol-3-phosphate acyltransferase [Anaerolineales bacterium]